MAGAHDGEDDRDFFHAAIERTYPPLAVTTGGAQTSDADGALPSGRYLIQAMNFIGASSIICWVRTGAFIKGAPLSLVSGPGLNTVPLNTGAAVAIEINVKKDYNDRIGAITSTGSCTVFITRVSRTSRLNK